MQNKYYQLPTVEMLTQGAASFGEDEEEIRRRRGIINQTLRDFDIAGEVTGFVTGPRVTRFEITLAPGINVKKVERIQDDICMALAATSIRVLAPIPGRSVVGVEVANSKPEAVFMRSVMENDEWKNSKAEIPLALGKNVSGEPVILDLAKAPHMLISGAVGTGKSVLMCDIVTSLLFRFSPDDLKLIMVDPKIVEFDAYKPLPHLLAPIIHDETRAAGALRWAANEMDRRYHVLAKVGVRKLSEFNRRPEIAATEKMPYLVIVLNELADLMMTETKKDVETNITRIAQKGRAAGIHIIVATQWPSTNIITGVIKANLPTRLCFQVRSLVDSRMVLDTPGAEKLLGTGDMLVMTTSSMELERVQAAFIPDDDLLRIAEFVSRQRKPEFSKELVKEQDNCFYFSDEGKNVPQEVSFFVTASKFIREGDDDLIRGAVMLLIRERKATVSYLQRRLKIGYNRAVEILEELEKRELVSPPSREDGKREILANFSQA